MRALVAIGIGAALLAIPASADAHTLSKQRAREATRTVVRLWIQPSMRWSSSVRRTGPCERRTAHRVRCGWSLSDPWFFCRGTILVGLKDGGTVYSLDRAPYCAVPADAPPPD